MNITMLDELDVLNELDDSIKSKWIHLQKDKELYEISSWLFMNLTKEKHERDHRRSQIRQILNWYYDTNMWTPKQKHMIGHSIIEYWPIRQLDKDPRFI